MNELKPCPFCGCAAELVADVLNGVAYIKCGNCDARAEKIKVDLKYCAIDYAIRAWNRRVNNETN